MSEQSTDYNNLKSLRDALITERRYIAQNWKGDGSASKAGEKIRNIQEALASVDAAMKEEYVADGSIHFLG